MKLARWLQILNGRITIHKNEQSVTVWQDDGELSFVTNNHVLCNWLEETVYAVNCIDQSYDLYLTEGEWNE